MEGISRLHSKLFSYVEGGQREMGRYRRAQPMAQGQRRQSQSASTSIEYVQCETSETRGPSSSGRLPTDAYLGVQFTWDSGPLHLSFQ